MIIKNQVMEILKYFECEDEIDLNQYHSDLTEQDIKNISLMIIEDLEDFEGTYQAFEYNARHFDCARQLKKLIGE